MSAFLAIILSALISFNGAFIDLIRYNAAFSMLNRDLKSAIISAMADYDGRIRSDYGLFINYFDKNAIKNSINKYLTSNINSNNENGIFLNDIMDIKYSYKNMDLNQLKKQIIDYSKYRVPVDIAENIIAKALKACDIDFIKKTQDMEVAVSKLKDRLTKVAELYNAGIVNLEKSLTEISNPLKIQTALEKIISCLDDRRNLLDDISSITADAEKEIPGILSQLGEYAGESSEQKLYIKSLYTEIDELRSGLPSPQFCKKAHANIVENIVLFKMALSEIEAGNAPDTNKIIKAYIKPDHLNIKQKELIKEYERYDNRKENEKVARDFLNKKDNNQKRISNETRACLPSAIMSVPDQKNNINTGDVNLDNEKYSESNLSFANDLFKEIKTGFSDLYENLLIDEYILSTFKCAVLKDYKGSYYTDFNDSPLTFRNTYLDNEVEYILNGKCKDSENLFIVKTEIYLFRFCMNTVHVYSDPQKKALAGAAALAVAALLTGGAASDLISNLIMWGWSAAESCLDVSDLMKGRKVPLYKLKNEWKLNIGLNRTDGTGNSNSYSISYMDYLRLLLLTVPVKTKLARIADLIQINTSMRKPGFKIMEACTGVKAEAIISEKIIFPVDNLYPNATLLNNGRFGIHVEQYSEYSL